MRQPLYRPNREGNAYTNDRVLFRAESGGQGGHLGLRVSQMDEKGWRKGMAKRGHTLANIS